MFFAAIQILNYKATNKQITIFTICYGLGVIFSRKIYSFLPVPFGTHTILLIILSTILFKNILKDSRWIKYIFTSLILTIALLISDTLIVLPSMKLLDWSVQEIQSSIFLTFLLTAMSDLTLVAIFIIGYFKNKNKRKASLSNY